MGKQSVAIIKSVIDVDKVLAELNAALSEEWLAFYQYWIGAAVAEGFLRPEVEGEFLQHAQEEFGHAALLVKRIKELDGIPVLDPKEWFNLARCKYDTPNDFDVYTLLQQNIQGERCAIARYQEIAAMTEGKDFVTCDMAKKILADEEEHEQDLMDYVVDIEKVYEQFKAKLGK